MEPSQKVTTFGQIDFLRDKLAQLCRQQEDKDTVLAGLLQNKNRLLEGLPVENPPDPSQNVQLHYKYILPLVKDIYLLELKVKEYQKEYEEEKLKCESARLGQVIFTASLDENECVLKRLARELREISLKEDTSTEKELEATSVTNITYLAAHDSEHLNEDLGITVLRSGVHVRVRIRSQVSSKNAHIISSESAQIGVNSDNHVPQLEDTVQDIIIKKRHTSDLVSLVSKYIEDEMAPYVIVIPLKKKWKSSKAIKSQDKTKASGTSCVKDSMKGKHS